MSTTRILKILLLLLIWIHVVFALAFIFIEKYDQANTAMLLAIFLRITFNHEFKPQNDD
jgi:hypothetical protein